MDFRNKWISGIEISLGCYFAQRFRASVQLLLFLFNNTLWCQLEDMFQLIVTPQGIEKVTIQLIDTPTKVQGD